LSPRRLGIFPCRPHAGPAAPPCSPLSVTGLLTAAPVGFAGATGFVFPVLPHVARVGAVPVDGRRSMTDVPVEGSGAADVGLADPQVELSVLDVVRPGRTPHRRGRTSPLAHAGRVVACGDPREVLTEGLIAEVYGARAAVPCSGPDDRPSVRYLDTVS